MLLSPNACMVPKSGLIQLFITVSTVNLIIFKTYDLMIAVVERLRKWVNHSGMIYKQ